MPNFVMLVGVPGCGKSTLAAKLKAEWAESDYQIVSRDDIVLLLGQHHFNRLDVTYNEAFRAIDQKHADRILNDKLQDLLAQRANIILDMTNLTKKSRRKKLAQVGKDYIKSAIYFPMQYGKTMQRASLRQGKHIGAKVLTDMLNSVEIPTAEEGFNILSTR